MRDNPAVRAVAELLHLSSDHGRYGVVPDVDPTGTARGVCNCLWKARTAVTGLANSQEVREWLSAELASKARLKPGGECTRYVRLVLDALGGGE